MTVSKRVVEIARERRVLRNTPGGRRQWRPWKQIVQEVRGEADKPIGAKRLEDAVRSQPFELPPFQQIEEGWRRGWEEDFPGEPYPGREEAGRRLREKLMRPRKPPRQR